MKEKEPSGCSRGNVRVTCELVMARMGWIF